MSQNQASKKMYVNCEIQRSTRLSRGVEKGSDGGSKPVKRQKITNVMDKESMYVTIWSLKESGVPVHEIAKRVGISRSFVDKLLSVLSFIGYEPSTYYRGEAKPRTIRNQQEFLSHFINGRNLKEISKMYGISEMETYSELETLKKDRAINPDTWRILLERSGPGKHAKLRDNKPKEWTFEEYEKLWMFHKKEKTWAFISRNMGYRHIVCKEKIKELKAIQFDPKEYFQGSYSDSTFDDDDNELLLLFNQGDTLREIAMYYNISELNVYSKLKQLIAEKKLNIGLVQLNRKIAVGYKPGSLPNCAKANPKPVSEEVPHFVEEEPPKNEKSCRSLISERKLKRRCVKEPLEYSFDVSIHKFKQKLSKSIAKVGIKSTKRWSSASSATAGSI